MVAKCLHTDVGDLDQKVNVGVVMVRIGFGGILYYNIHIIPNPPISIGNYLGPL